MLGGGIVAGSLVLVGGDPGIGKSTLLLQVCQRLSASRKILYISGEESQTQIKLRANRMGSFTGTGKSTLLLQVCQRLSASRKILYISGEESQTQIKLRANRMGSFTDYMLLLCETNLDTIRTAIERQNPELVIIDSIQTMYNEEVSSAPGSVSQVRESTHVLMQLAKGMGIPIFIVGHVTKEGTVAGPRVLEHMVDTVLYFEGDRHASYRILRAVKNRFGSTNEIGVFEMRREGLVEVENPSEYMLSGKPENASGSVVACSMEGTRPILIEIQALVCQSNFGMPRRTAAGTDYNRVNLLMAVLEKRIGLPLSNYDAYVNIAGGIKMNEPAIDLGIIMALVSSYKNRAIDEKMIVFGEVGLSGEVRAVSMPEQRVAEAIDLGIIMALVSSYKNRAIDEKMIVFGEVGLSGEVRAVSMPEQRVAEAKKLGFETCILPNVCLDMLKEIKGIKLLGVGNISDAINLL